jgi:hypothetical protein
MSFFFYAFTHAANIGSDTAVTRFGTQQTVNNGDRIAAFAALTAGFRMANSSASGIFDSFLRCREILILTLVRLCWVQIFFLVIRHHLILWAILGGLNHVLDLASSMTIIPVNTSTTPNNVFFSDIDIFLSNDVTLKDVSITFSGESMISGRGNTVTLSPTFSLVVASGGSLLLQDIKIKGVNDSKMRCLSSLSTFSFQDVTLVLDGNFTFTQGRMDILKRLTISGADKAFIYTSNDQSTIRGGRFGTGNTAPTYVGTLLIDDSTTFSYVPRSGSSTLLNLESSVSKIILNSGTLFATTMQLTKGILQVEGKSRIQGLTSFTVGDGLSVSNNLYIEIKPAANLDILGTFSYKNI